MSIVIVDDSRVTRTHLRWTLESAGYAEIVEAPCGLDALRVLGVTSDDVPDHGVRSHSAALPDAELVLLDVMLPDMDGVSVCQRIKEAPHLQDVPVIMVTGQTEVERLAEAFASGATDYISKSSTDVELLARVRSAVKLKHEIDRRKTREAELLQLARRLEEANARLERLSSLDGLTGIANRRHLDDYLASQWALLSASLQLSLIMVDVDHFKRFNDTFGHQIGDECLKRVAGVLAATLEGERSLVARYGGEEFVAVLPGIDLTGAMVIGEMLRAQVAEIDLAEPRAAAAMNVTISVGVANTLVCGLDSPEELIAAADAALYQAKQRGRNQVCIAEPQSAPQVLRLSGACATSQDTHRMANGLCA